MTLIWVWDTISDGNDAEDFSPPLVFMLFALYPAALLFHDMVFITKSNILLCKCPHPSPPGTDFRCTSAGKKCVSVCLMELWQGLRATQRHMCRNPAALLSAVQWRLVSTAQNKTMEFKLCCHRKVDYKLTWIMQQLVIQTTWVLVSMFVLCAKVRIVGSRTQRFWPWCDMTGQPETED